MKKLDKRTIAQVITMAAMEYIISNEINEDCYNAIRETFGLSTKQIDEILDKYNDILEELADQYQDILADWVITKL
jgi:uncharacterized protein YbjQ (UPF0145 family)